MQLFELFFRQNLAYLSLEDISKVSLKLVQPFRRKTLDGEIQLHILYIGLNYLIHNLNWPYMVSNPTFRQVTFEIL